MSLMTLISIQEKVSGKKEFLRCGVTSSMAVQRISDLSTIKKT